MRNNHGVLNKFKLLGVLFERDIHRRDYINIEVLFFDITQIIDLNFIPSIIYLQTCKNYNVIQVLQVDYEIDNNIKES